MFVTFFVCWSPFLVYVLLYQLTTTTHDNGVRQWLGSQLGPAGCRHVSRADVIFPLFLISDAKAYSKRTALQVEWIIIETMSQIPFDV